MTLSVSIVSHRHGVYLPALLRRLANVSVRIERVWLIFDVAEPATLVELERTPWPFDLRCVVNTQSQSFGRNHNRAFHLECQSVGHVPHYWWILNPDVEWREDPTPSMLAAFSDPTVGLVYPEQVDVVGKPQDHERLIPTPLRVLRRMLARLAGVTVETLEQPDWVSGSCVLVRGDVYNRLGGFDERYRLYVEDVEFCLRLRLAGYILRRASNACVMHVAQRRSHRDLQHLSWHLAGFMRLWTSSTFWKYVGRTFR